MTATNHALTGAIIGLSVSNPFLALTLAFLSHFVLDATPHYTDEKLEITSRGYKRYLAIDLSICVVLALRLVIVHPSGWFLACWCAFVATSPDLMWLPYFVRASQGKAWRQPTHLLARFHSRIQWFARPIGAWVEIAWAAGAVVLLAKLI